MGKGDQEKPAGSYPQPWMSGLLQHRQMHALSSMRELQPVGDGTQRSNRAYVEPEIEPTKEPDRPRKQKETQPPNLLSLQKNSQAKRVDLCPSSLYYKPSHQERQNEPNKKKHQQELCGVYPSPIGSSSPWH